MRILATLSALTIAAATLGQCAITDLGMDPATQKMIIKGIAESGDGFVTVMKPASPYAYDGVYQRTILVTKNDMDGSVVWNRIVAARNSTFGLMPRNILGTQDGGGLVYGEVMHRTGPIPDYLNQFAIKIGSTGEVEWARIYQFPDSCGVPESPQGGNRTAIANAVSETEEGELHWVILGCKGTYDVHLDAAGLPLSSRMYKDDLMWPGSCNAIALRNGGIFGYNTVYMEENRPGRVYRTDADGNILWTKELGPIWDQHPTLFFSHAYEMFDNDNEVIPSSLLELRNGDLVLFAQGAYTSAIVRLNAAGDVIWSRGVDNADDVLFYDFESLAEDVNGDLIAPGHWSLRIPGNGVGPMSKWVQTPRFRFIRSINDQLVMPLLAGTGEQATVSVMTMGSGDDLVESCGSVPDIDAVLVPLTLTDVPYAMGVLDAEIRSWPMALTDPLRFDLDLRTSGSFGVLRPGFAAQVMGLAANNSATDSEGFTLQCTVPADITVGTVTPAPTTVSGSTYTWVVPGGLAPFAAWNFVINGTLAADVELIGTTATATVSVTHNGAESQLQNNTHTFVRTISGAFDPNNKLVNTSSGQQDGVYHPALDEWVDYTINFQNTGTDTAFTVVITDTLAAHLSTAAFQPIGATHPYTWSIGGNGVVRFVFDNILLPDSNVNEPLSHGAVSFRTKPLADVPLGTVIANNADILFDFNPPIRTDDAVFTIAISTSVAEQSRGRASVHPVPAGDRLVLTLPPGAKAQRILITAMDGRTLLSTRPVIGVAGIDVALEGLPAGAYLLTAELTDGGRLSTRFVKR
ncbi:MAG TPA: T9SS type A sorting domain-containing protein [Flavobacteriales bacterium]